MISVLLLTTLAWLITIVGGVLAVPFFTLYERKMLSYIQNRKGPNKVSAQGILQPMTDGVKLIFKGALQPILSNAVLYTMSPLASFMITLSMWGLMSLPNGSYSLFIGLVMFVCLSSMSVYTLLAAGWSSKSKYSFLGSLRGAAQTMSYEVCFVAIVFLPAATYSSYKFKSFMSSNIWFVSAMLMTSVLWLVCILAETNRAPFDFAEGESELVSGFNTEYGALGFTFLFLSEYGAILMKGMIFVMMLSPYIGTGAMLLVPTLMVLARGALPRFRYDLLMTLAWKSLLPFSLLLLFIMFML